MQSITDVIEEFILSTMAQDDMIELSRNDLAKYFSCVPSQINYVLNTRFTLNKGYLIESARGGAGFVKVIRINQDKCYYQAFNYTEAKQNSKAYLIGSILQIQNYGSQHKRSNYQNGYYSRYKIPHFQYSGV